jgi:hypothetical protein
MESRSGRTADRVEGETVSNAGSLLKPFRFSLITLQRPWSLCSFGGTCANPDSAGSFFGTPGGQALDKAPGRFAP